MNKIRVNNQTYVDVSKPLTKKTKKLLKNAKPAKKYFCYNFLWNKLSIGLWEFPVLNKKKVCPTFFNCYIMALTNVFVYSSSWSVSSFTYAFNIY